MRRYDARMKHPHMNAHALPTILIEKTSDGLRALGYGVIGGHIVEHQFCEPVKLRRLIANDEALADLLVVDIVLKRARAASWSLAETRGPASTEPLDGFRLSRAGHGLELPSFDDVTSISVHLTARRPDVLVELIALAEADLPFDPVVVQ